MTKRVSYPVTIKREAVKMKLEGVPTKVIMEQLRIKNKTQAESWVRWYKVSLVLDTLEQVKYVDPVYALAQRSRLCVHFL